MNIHLYLFEYKKTPADRGYKKKILFSFKVTDLKPLSPYYQLLNVIKVV